MKQILLLSVVLVIANVAAQNSRHTSSCSQLQQQGIICSADCTTVQMCLQSGSGWETIDLQTCVGNFCDASEATCNDKSTCLPPTSITCTSLGTFPDAFDCQRYHVCTASTGNSDVNECGTNLAFNFRENLCTFDTNDFVCKERQFRCTANGDMGTWGGDDMSSLYYICVSTGNTADPFKPLIRRCPGKQYFNGTTCVNKGDGAVTSHTTDTELPVTTLPSVPCTTTKNVYDPENCYWYYDCTTGKPIRTQCAAGTYFNANLGSCSSGVCYN